MAKNKVKANLRRLARLAKSLDRNISIKVGIIGGEAGQKHEASNLTNAELGAVHEFGASIPVTEKMRNYLHYKGIHLKADTTSINIPTRSFLRETLLSDEGHKKLTKVVSEALGHRITAEDFASDEQANKVLDDVAHLIAENAYMEVMKAFENGGNPTSWTPISKVTLQNRKQTKQSDTPLTDTGDLRHSISYSIDGKQWG